MSDWERKCYQGKQVISTTHAITLVGNDWDEALELCLLKRSFTPNDHDFYWLISLARIAAGTGCAKSLLCMFEHYSRFMRAKIRAGMKRSVDEIFEFPLNDLLESAAGHGHTSVMRLLVAFGANDFAEAIDSAASGNKVDALLLAFQFYNEKSGGRDRHRISGSLGRAASCGYVRVVSILCNRIDPSMQTIRDAVYSASWGGHIRTVKYLLRRYPSETRANCLDASNTAAQGGFTKILKLLNQTQNMNYQRARKLAEKHGKHRAVALIDKWMSEKHIDDMMDPDDRKGQVRED